MIQYFNLMMTMYSVMKIMSMNVLHISIRYKPLQYMYYYLTILLQQELESLGISVIEEEPSIVRLLNIVYELTQYNRTTTRKMDDITTRYNTSNSRARQQHWLSGHPVNKVSVELWYMHAYKHTYMGLSDNSEDCK